jgi:RNA polymerase sigma factor (sigma-70 family)
MSQLQVLRAAEYVRRLASQIDGAPDRELLRVFALRRDEAAMAELVRRHAALVFHSARRRLGNTADAEDVVQATFLILARKAGAIRCESSVAGWLHCVAVRLAARVKKRSLHRHVCEQLSAAHSAPDPLGEVSGRELCGIVDEEVARLPERYRLPLILCCLEGLARDEAAVQLGWPFSKLKWRLERARALLKSRLARRGITPSAGLIGMVAAGDVHADLQAAALRAALHGEPPVVAAAGLAQHFLAQWSAKRSRQWVVVAAACLIGLGYAFAPGDPPKPPTEKPAAAREVAAIEAPLPAGAVARVGSARFRHGDGVYSVSFSPDGKQIVSGSSDGSARVWDLATGSLRHRIATKANESARAAFSPDGTKLLVCDGQIARILDAKTGKQLQSHSLNLPQYSSYAVAADARTMAYLKSDASVVVLDVRNGMQLSTISTQNADPATLAFSPGNKYLATALRAGISVPCAVSVFDLATGKHVIELKEDGRSVHFGAFGPRGETIVTLRDDAQRTGPGGPEAVLTEMATGKEIRRIGGLDPTAYCAAISPDGKILAIGSLQRNGVQTFDLATGKAARRLHCWPSVFYIAFSPDGKTVAAARSSGVMLWDLATGQPHPAAPDPLGDVYHLRFTDNDQSLLIASGDLAVRDWRSGRIVRRYEDRRSPNYVAFGEAISPDERLLAVIDLKEPIRLVDTRTGDDVRRLDGPGFADPALFSPDGQRVFARCFNKSVRVWDTASGKLLHTFQAGENYSGDGLCVSRDGELLGAITEENQGTVVRIWNLKNGRKMREFVMSPSGAPGRAGLFTPDGTRLIVTGPPMEGSPNANNVRVLDLATGKERHFNGDGGPVLAMALSPNGRTLATSGNDKSIRLWELASLTERHRFNVSDNVVYRLAFSANGRYLASAGAESPILVWDVLAPEKSEKSENSWADLAGEPTVAFRAIRRLAASPDEALKVFRERLKPIPPPDKKKVEQWLADLDGPRFADREKASAELAKVADQIEERLRQVWSQTDSPEVRRRLERVLEQPVPPPERLRELRAIEVLERIDTPEARRIRATLP